MTCREINNLLPAYLEDILSPEEKETVESHLASCPPLPSGLGGPEEDGESRQGSRRGGTAAFFRAEDHGPGQGRGRAEKGDPAEIFLSAAHQDSHPSYGHGLLVAVLAFYVYQKNEPEMRLLTPFPIPSERIRKGSDNG